MDAMQTTALLLAVWAVMSVTGTPPLHGVLPPVAHAGADDVPVFNGLPLESDYSPSWNQLRLTGRGLDAPHESFTVVVRPDSTAIIMR